MKNTNILISGAGIAGITLAYWLKKWGFNPMVIEKAPSIPQGGYMIDFFGKGVDVAHKMGLKNVLEKVDAGIEEVQFVNKNNKKTGGFKTGKFRRILKKPMYNLRRSELINILYNLSKPEIEIVFSETITALHEHEAGVEVQFASGTSKNFDLVIGADGIHSKVRSLVFGPEEQFEKYFGYHACSYSVPNFIDTNSGYLSYTIPGKQVAVYPGKDNMLTTFFVFKKDKKFESRDPEFQKKYLKEIYADMKWFTPSLLEKLDDTEDFYFDSVSQIKMSNWSKGRISLAGDACDCPSLLSGQGSTLAMVGAYVLAGELKIAHGNYREAFKRYEEIFKPLINNKQKLAEDFSESFVPRNHLQLWIRNTFTNLMFVPLVSKWLANKFMVDHIDLKDY